MNTLTQNKGLITDTIVAKIILTLEEYYDHDADKSAECALDIIKLIYEEVERMQSVLLVDAELYKNKDRKDCLIARARTLNNVLSFLQKESEEEKTKFIEMLSEKVSITRE